MRAWKFLLLLVSILTITGCAGLYKDYGVSPIEIDQISTAQKLQSAITKTDDNDKNLNHVVSAACFNIPVGPTEADKCKQQRNAAVATLLNASDDMCQAHLKTIFGNDAAFNIITGSITNLAAGWATFTNGLAAKSTLSAVAAFSNAERSLVNETVYKNLLVTAVTTKIRQARDDKAAALIPANLNKEIADYSMLAATRDVITYHYTCSFMFGLEKALNEGIQPTLDSRKSRLELDRQMLESQISTTKSTGANTAGLSARIIAIDAELLNLIKVQK